MKIPNQQKVWDNIAEEWSKYREKPIEEVTDFLKDKKGKVLDLGCGSGRHLLKIPNTKIYLIDFSPKMVELAKKKAKELKISAEITIARAEKLPFKDNFFNAVICTALLHGIKSSKSREKTIKEIFRVLKPKGKAFISVWSKSSKWFKNREKETTMKWRDKGIRYLYLYEPKEFYNLIKNIGFLILKSKENRNIIIIAQKPL